MQIWNEVVYKGLQTFPFHSLTPPPPHMAAQAGLLCILVFVCGCVTDAVTALFWTAAQSSALGMNWNP